MERDPGNSRGPNPPFSSGILLYCQASQKEPVHDAGGNGLMSRVRLPLFS